MVSWLLNLSQLHCPFSYKIRDNVNEMCRPHSTWGGHTRAQMTAKHALDPWELRLTKGAGAKLSLLSQKKAVA